MTQAGPLRGLVFQASARPAEVDQLPQSVDREISIRQIAEMLGWIKPNTKLNLSDRAQNFLPLILLRAADQAANRNGAVNLNELRHLFDDPIHSGQQNANRLFLRNKDLFHAAATLFGIDNDGAIDRSKKIPIASLEGWQHAFASRAEKVKGNKNDQTTSWAEILTYAQSLHGNPAAYSVSQGIFLFSEQSVAAMESLLIGFTDAEKNLLNIEGLAVSFAGQLDGKSPIDINTLIDNPTFGWDEIFDPYHGVPLAVTYRFDGRYDPIFTPFIKRVDSFRVDEVLQPLYQISPSLYENARTLVAIQSKPSDALAKLNDYFKSLSNDEQAKILRGMTKPEFIRWLRQYLKDKGHLFPAAAAASYIVKWLSFLMSNMNAQYGVLNQRAWAWAEDALRVLAVATKSQATVSVVTLFTDSQGHTIPNDQLRLTRTVQPFQRENLVNLDHGNLTIGNDRIYVHTDEAMAIVLSSADTADRPPAVIAIRLPNDPARLPGYAAPGSPPKSYSLGDLFALMTDAYTSVDQIEQNLAERFNAQADLFPKLSAELPKIEGVAANNLNNEGVIALFQQIATRFEQASFVPNLVQQLAVGQENPLDTIDVMQRLLYFWPRIRNARFAEPSTAQTESAYHWLVPLPRSLLEVWKKAMNTAQLPW